MDNFDIDDVTLGVYATSQLTKLLTALDEDVTFMLADLSVIRQVPAMKQLPDFNVKINLTKDFADKFVKSKNALPETENFAIESDALGTNMILNYSTLNTNRI